MSTTRKKSKQTDKAKRKRINPVGRREQKANDEVCVFTNVMPTERLYCCDEECCCLI